MVNKISILLACHNYFLPCPLHSPRLTEIFPPTFFLQDDGDTTAVSTTTRCLPVQGQEDDIKYTAQQDEVASLRKRLDAVCQRIYICMWMCGLMFLIEFRKVRCELVVLCFHFIYCHLTLLCSGASYETVVQCRRCGTWRLWGHKIQGAFLGYVIFCLCDT